MLTIVKKVFFTLIFLKPIQIAYQLIFRFKRKKHVVSKDFNYKDANNDLNILDISSRTILYKGKKTFKFLNLEKQFLNGIDWNFSDYGKLWNYNLEYFGFLNQNNLSSMERIYLLEDFYGFSEKSKRKLEPYPISIRAINIIKFFVNEKIGTHQLQGYLYQELAFLHKNYEYHILGNHLLENAFALFLGGAYYKVPKWHNKAKKILIKELKEQILEDGAHFELSPMYHMIILFRLLQLVEWYENYDEKDVIFLAFCRHKSSIMLTWLNNIKFGNYDFPLFNDSAYGISHSVEDLFSYAMKLKLQIFNLPLSQSGYRSFQNEIYEIKFDLAQIGASYQPGHVHADALSFILYFKNQPLFVEQGTSTYQIGRRRELERSTEAHNTVVVDNRNQSEVWAGFRVAQRASIKIHRESGNFFEASHDGYKNINIIHYRTFLCNAKEFVITDRLSKTKGSIFYLHLHPNYSCIKKDKLSIAINSNIKIFFKGASKIQIEEYDYSDSYNHYSTGKRILAFFEKELVTNILFEN